MHLRRGLTIRSRVDVLGSRAIRMIDRAFGATPVWYRKTYTLRIVYRHGVRSERENASGEAATRLGLAVGPSAMTSRLPNLRVSQRENNSTIRQNFSNSR